MIQRRIVVPAGVDRLWRALTDPDEAGRWMGGRLEWTPAEGGALRFCPGPPDGAGAGVGAAGGAGGGAAGGAADGGDGVREGRVEEVVPGRYMRFAWWPVDGGPDGASEVAYSLEPVISPPGGEEASPSTILTVEEVPAAAPAAARVGPSASIASGLSGRSASPSIESGVSARGPAWGPAWGPAGGPTWGPAWGPGDEIQLRRWAAHEAAYALAGAA